MESVKISPFTMYVINHFETINEGVNATSRSSRWYKDMSNVHWPTAMNFLFIAYSMSPLEH